MVIDQGLTQSLSEAKNLIISLSKRSADYFGVFFISAKRNFA